MKEWIAGRNPVLETLRANRRHVSRILLASGIEPSERIAEILKTAANRKIPLEKVPRERLDKIGENPQGVAAEVNGYPYVDIADILARAKDRSEDLFVLVLDVIQNPQNLGTLLRTAEAAGVHGVVIPQHRAAEVTPAVVSASSGASEHMLIAQGNLVRAIETIKDTGGWIVGMEAGEGSKPLGEVPLTGPIAIVVGSEGEGIRPLVRENCDFLLSLPMHGKVDSLNAAVAGSILLYQVLLARENRAGK